MQFRSVAFASALFLLVAGILGSHYVLTSISNGGGTHRFPNISSALTANTRTAQPQPTVTPRPAPARSARRTAPSRAIVARTAVPIPAHRVPSPPQGPVIHQVNQTGVTRGPLGVSAPVAIPQPTALALAPTTYTAPAGLPVQQGIVRLVTYWVGTPRVPRGQTVSIGYVIDNELGVTVRLMLGASIKLAHGASWASGALSDPAHDVVATVAPGTTTHARFFTLLPNLRAGTYDVAWGLRDAQTGHHVVLATAANALQVTD